MYICHCWELRSLAEGSQCINTLFVHNNCVNYFRHSRERIITDWDPVFSQVELLKATWIVGNTKALKVCQNIGLNLLVVYQHVKFLLVKQHIFANIYLLNLLVQDLDRFMAEQLLMFETKHALDQMTRWL